MPIQDFVKINLNKEKMLKYHQQNSSVQSEEEKNKIYLEEELTGLIKVFITILICSSFQDSLECLTWYNYFYLIIYSKLPPKLISKEQCPNMMKILNPCILFQLLKIIMSKIYQLHLNMLPIQFFMVQHQSYPWLHYYFVDEIRY